MGAGRFRRAGLVAIVVVLFLASSCASSPTGPTASTSPAPTTGTSSASTPTSTTGAAGPGSDGAPSTRDQLAQLVIDDDPHPDHPYDRSDWPHWADTDGDGCDAREQALRDQSHTVAQIDPIGCKVIAGDWVSPYDGFAGEDPTDFDIDHVVALENAHESGGWRWDVDQRRRFANDQANLLVVSASANRSKGDRSPDQWRPPRQEAWCLLATRWVAVKVAYGLTATTSERDALGQMLDTCG